MITRPLAHPLMRALQSQLQTLTQIKKRADFLKIQKHGQKWISKGFVLQVCANDLGQKRVGFTVTKRTEKSAVARNRIKRRLRAISADILPLHAQDKHDYILIGRSEALTRPYDQMRKDLKWCLRKLEKLQN